MPIEPAARDLLVALARVLTSWGPWYVFGAQAVAVYGVPRLSADVDITIRDLDAVRIRSILKQLEEALGQRDLVPAFERIAGA